MCNGFGRQRYNFSFEQQSFLPIYFDYKCNIALRGALSLKDAGQNANESWR